MQVWPFGYNLTLMTGLFSRYLLIVTVFMATNAYPQELPGGEAVDPGVVTVPVENMPVADPLQSDQAVTGPGSGPALIETSGIVAVAEPPPPPPPVVVATPAAPEPDIGQEERTRSMIIFIAAVILIITLGTLIVLLVKRGRFYKQASDIHASEAYLYDLNRRTTEPRYKLGSKATMFGRVAGKDSAHLDYIVIPESTIGRRHATIEYKDYAYWIMDQGSINGTFVNNIPITSETRLKHNDRIRLHKVEFVFIMPDMEAAGMTRLAEPADANAVSSEEMDIDAIKAGMAGQAFDLDLDFPTEERPAAVIPAGGKDETLLPGFGGDVARADPDEVTLMPDYNYSAEPKPAATAGAGASSNKIKTYEDETLMPNSFKDVDDEATIRPAINSSSNGIFDPTGSDDKDS